MYLRAIEIFLQDAFPQSKIRVVAEESLFYPMHYEIKAYVDEYGAYVTPYLYNQRITERHVADLLIELIREQMGGERNGTD